MLHRPRGEKVARAVSHPDAPSNNNCLLQLDAAHACSRAVSQCNRERLVPHADLVFIQNGMLQPWLDEKGLGDNTQACASSQLPVEPVSFTGLWLACTQHVGR